MPKYDVAVIGAGIAGLSAAALLTRARQKVVVMDPSDSAGGAVTADESHGFRFAAGPNLTFGLEPGGHLQRLYAALGLSPGSSRFSSSYQVAMPDRRITVSADQQETLDELRREFPREIDGIARLFSDARALGQRSARNRVASFIQQHRSAGKFLRSYRFSDELNAFFDVQSFFFLGQALGNVPLASLVMMLNTAPQHLPGGFNHLADQLLSVIQDQDGTWLPGQPFPEMLFRSNWISGIRTSHETFEPQRVLLNTAGKQQEPVLFLGIREEVVPVGMLPTVISIDDYRRPQDYCSFSLSLPGDSEAAPPGMRALTVSFPAAAGADPPQEPLQDRVNSVIPFLAKHLVVSTVPDHAARRFPLPLQSAGRSSGARQARMTSPASPIRNLTIIQDSARTLLSAVHAVQAFAPRLV